MVPHGSQISCPSASHGDLVSKGLTESKELGEFILRGNCHIVISTVKQKTAILRVRGSDGALKLNSTNDFF